jgi:hypothetical protein
MHLWEEIDSNFSLLWIIKVQNDYFLLVDLMSSVYVKRMKFTIDILLKWKTDSHLVTAGISFYIQCSIKSGVWKLGSRYISNRVQQLEKSRGYSRCSFSKFRITEHLSVKDISELQQQKYHDFLLLIKQQQD